MVDIMLTYLNFKGLNYKSLMEAKTKPLDVIRPVLNSRNVHVIAKLASKIPDQVNLFERIFCLR